VIQTVTDDAGCGSGRAGARSAFLPGKDIIGPAGQSAIAMASFLDRLFAPQCQFCGHRCNQPLQMADDMWFRKHIASDSNPLFCSEACLVSWVDRECDRRSIANLSRCTRCRDQLSRRFFYVSEQHWFHQHVLDKSEPRFCSEECLQEWIESECRARSIRPFSAQEDEEFDVEEFEFDVDGNDVTEHEGWCPTHQEYCWGECDAEEEDE
jgi:hypothetical protein